MKIFLIIISIFLLSFTGKTQNMMAVAKNSDGSHVAWVRFYNMPRMERKAKNFLYKNGFKNVEIISKSSCGHKIKTGYYVIIKTTYRTFKGSFMTRYAMGVSSTLEEAEINAVRHLKLIDWDWDDFVGYRVEKIGRF